MNLDAWDFVFFVVVLAQSTCVAYLKSPGSKAFAMTLPIPLTFGVLALGQPINATHVGGLLTGALYIFLIYLLHARLRVPIVLTIIIGISVYCIVGTCAGRLLPRTPAAFWGMIGLSGVLAAALLVMLPNRVEPGHRSSLPVWLKLLALALIIICLLLLKGTLHGFMTTFPIIGIIAAYEARHSLWTVFQRFTAFIAGGTSMLATARILGPHVTLGAAIAVGWLPFCLVMYVAYRGFYTSPSVAAPEPADGPS
jgi:hypothetical protein